MIKVMDGEEVIKHMAEHIPMEPIKVPEYSEWKCHLFGSYKNSGFTWVPLKGEEPNWFWRWMQYLCFGNRWVKEKNKYEFL